MKILQLFLLAAIVAMTALTDAVLGVLCLVIVLPLALLLGGALMLLDLMSRALAPFARPSPTPEDGEACFASSVSVVIPSWNGVEQLRQLMPSLVIALDQQGGDHEIIVVDNGSDDESIDFLRSNFRSVRIVALNENRFFGGGITAGISEASKDILVVLNNDMVVEPDFLAPLLAGFDRPDVFAVTSQIHFQDSGRRREETGKTRAAMLQGRLELEHLIPNDTDERLGFTPAFWAGGGSSAYDRRKLVELGGFDPIYDPFYYEDTDLSYRAWKRGWVTRFAAKSQVHHEHRASVSRFRPDWVASIVQRNHYLFIWCNITKAGWTASHFFWLAFHMAERARRGPGPYRQALRTEVAALWGAVRRLPEVVLRRRDSHWRSTLSDSEVFSLANSTHRTAASRWTATAEQQDRPLRILVLSTRLPRLGTDGSWILFNRLEELARRHEISLFSFLDHEDEAIQAEPLRKFCKTVTTHVRTRIKRPGNAHHLTPYRLARDYSAGHLRHAVRCVLESEDFDIVQVEYSEMAHLVQNQLDDLATVYTVHEPLGTCQQRLYDQTRGLKKLLRGFEWAQNLDHELRVVQEFDHVVTLSSSDEDDLHDYLPDLNITTIPSAVDDHLIKEPSIEANKPHILFVGYFRHPPNVDAATWLANSIFPIVRRKIPEAKLFIVGMDPSPEVQALDSLPGVEVTGYVEDLNPYVAEASVIAIPIRLGAGLRGKVLEAWAAAKAVVITSRGAEGFAVEHGTNALIADAAGDFAAGLIACMEDSGLRERLGKAGQEVVINNHTVAAAAARYEDVYAEVLNGRWRRSSRVLSREPWSVVKEGHPHERRG